MGLLLVLLVMVVAALLAAAAYLATRVFTHDRQLGNLVDDINDKNVEHRKATNQVTSAVTAVSSNLQTQLLATKSGIDAFNQVLQVASPTSFFNAATMLPPPNVDLKLLAHTTAMAGITVVGGLDVSGGAFSVDAASGIVRMCNSSTNVCSEFNHDDTTYLRSDRTVVTGSSLDASGADVIARTMGITDANGVINGGVFIDATGTTNLASRGSTALSSVGPLTGGTYAVSTLQVDGGNGMTVTSAQVNSTNNTVVPGSLKQVLHVTPAGDVTITTPGALTLSAATIDISGAITYHGAAIPPTVVAPTAVAPVVAPVV